jgi:hypothetical protein
VIGLCEGNKSIVELTPSKILHKKRVMSFSPPIVLLNNLKVSHISVFFSNNKEKIMLISITILIDPGSTGYCGHVFSGAYELKNDLGSGSGKSFEDI